MRSRRLFNKRLVNQRLVNQRWLKRATIRRVMICIVLGGVMTIAVAWGCALSVQVFKFLFAPTDLYETNGLFFEAYLPQGWPVQRTRSTSHITGSTWRTSISYPLAEPFEDRAAIITQREAGLPFRSMFSISYNLVGKKPSDPELIPLNLSRLDVGIDVPSWFPERFRDKVLPLRPMWPGFVYSMLLYGSLAWLVLSANAFMHKRRLSRLRQTGLCVHCKYPLGGFAVCPECGHATGEG